MTNINTRAALALRGRYGADVWQAWSNLGGHAQQDWLARVLPERDTIQTRRALIGILHKEGIKRELEAKCCDTCASPTVYAP